MDLEAELVAARDLDVATIADAIESIGFECTRCGHCCMGTDEEHTATVFPDEISAIQTRDGDDWREVARPMPFGLDQDGTAGETFEWALQTDACGNCTFYDDEASACSIYEDRPLICRTYPFSLVIEDTGGTDQMGSVVERSGSVRAHECDGLGRDITRADAETLAETLKERTVRDLEEAIAVRDNYEPVETDGIVVHDSEGQKRPDGTPID
ncbi:MAG: YkgJ family cysteine cluster protein [Halorhabdus sp.]